jgi:hypothetical protein
MPISPRDQHLIADLYGPFFHLSYSCATPFGPAILVTQDPLRTLPIRAFEWNHCKLGGIDQDLLEYLYSGAALS